MRAGKAAGLVLAALFAVGVSARVSAHRRDEYLQTARVAIEPTSVEVQLDLTPGIAVAESIIAAVDRNRDGAFSPEEERDYVAQVVHAIEVRTDDRPVALEAVASRFPDVAALRSGEGTIQLRLVAAVRSPVGTHQLRLRNTHRPDASVYLANALVPTSDRISVTAQRRDPEQRELLLDYTVHADPVSHPMVWLWAVLNGRS